jgi:hypothetical protein
MPRKILRYIGFAIGAIAILGAVAGGLVFAMLHHFDFSPPQASYPRPESQLDAQRQDLDYFGKLLAFDRSFSSSARDRAQGELSALVSLQAPLRPEKLRVALMSIAALADNGHTHVSSGDGAELKALPIRVARFSDGLYVMRAKDEYSDVLGGRVESVDGVPAAEVMRRLELLRGGLQGWRELNATYYIAIQDILFGASISPSPARSTWRFRFFHGREATRSFAAYRPAPNEPAPLPVRWYSTEPLAELSSGWRTLAMTSNTLPVPLRNYAANFRRVRLPNTCVIFLQLKAITDVDGQGLGAFLDDTERDLRARPACNVILDLRYSVGGDFTKIASFGRRLPQLVAPNGKVYVLTTAMTFSASIAAVGFVKQAGGARVQILGEPIGDRLAFFSEGNSGCLPNSHLCLDLPRAKMTSPGHVWIRTPVFGSTGSIRSV